jgi:hypothetical protein
MTTLTSNSFGISSCAQIPSIQMKTRRFGGWGRGVDVSCRRKQKQIPRSQGDLVMTGQLGCYKIRVPHKLESLHLFELRRSVPWQP